MTHPNREELAGALLDIDYESSDLPLVRFQGRMVHIDNLMASAAAALRQSPTVEEVHDVILTRLYGPCDQISDQQDAAIFDAARAVDRLYRGSKE